jgi:Tol biopolymer transport system component
MLIRLLGFAIPRLLVFFLAAIGLTMLGGRLLRGAELAFVRDDFIASGYNIYLMDVDRGITVNLTRESLFYGDFDWSPDGEHMALELAHDNQMYIYRFDFYGGLSTLGVGSQPAWSPDGEHIAYIARGDTQLQIHTMDTAGSDVRRWTDFTTLNLYPAWSPDGQHITFISGIESRAVYVLDVNGGTLQHITDSLERAWSPNSDLLVYSAYQQGNYDLFAIEIATGATRQLTDTLEDERYPVWSPTGEHLAFIATYGYDDILCIMAADGTVQQIDLSTQLGYRVYAGEAPVWSPDGTRLVLALVTPLLPNTYNLYLVESDGTVRQLTAEGRSEFHPAWRP